MNRLLLLLVLCIVILLPAGLFAQILPPDWTLEQVATGFGFTEGPVSDGDGGIWFTDLVSLEIWRYDVATGSTEKKYTDSDGSNGLLFDLDGNLIAAEQYANRVTSRDGSTSTVLADEWGGQPLNNPNDLVMDMRGGIYFTDPAYWDHNQDEAVYYLTPEGQLERVLPFVDEPGHSVRTPNGIALSLDGQTLYLAETMRGRIQAYDVESDGMLTNEREFAPASFPDGLTVDQLGNLYVAEISGWKVTAWNPAGEKLFEFELPERPSNVAFGDDGNTLYITAGSSLYSVELNVVNAVPEPSSIALLGAGILLFSGLFRRRGR